MNLTEKDANKFIVTGCSSGIGEAISEALLRAGHKVVGISRRNNEQLSEYSHFSHRPLDLSKTDSLPDEFNKIVDEHPDIYGVLFCAGHGRFGSLEEFSFQQIQDLIQLNLVSQMYLARAVLPTLKKNGRGHLIFIGSEAALVGTKRGSVYCATKFGLRGLAQSLRQECASRGIKTCIINPGMAKTAFFDQLDFTHGEDESNFIDAEDIASTVINIISLNDGTVVDEINLSPLKKVVQPK